MSPRSRSTLVDGAESGSATIATVERAADILMHFASTPQTDFGVTEIAEELGLSKAAVHRVLASLRSRGLVELDERTRRYSLGVSAMKLGLTYLERIDVRRVGRPYLQELTARTDETATLSVRVGDRSRVYVDQITPEREVIMAVTLGEPYPLHAGASSRALLAFLPEDKIEAYISSGPLQSMTASTIIDPGMLREDLAAVREQGWARSSAERKNGAASVAAPVRGHDGYAVAVVSVCGPLERFSAEFEGCRDALLHATRTLSRQFGFDG
ncbi:MULTISPECIES: IclR family transcriptional regulator [unclassified Nocardioides]|uniref:IclR family transcriptional regulator n=1 Tax=unclassified Nocardioides TaxID=2615069 RepID=UPI0000571BE1|nr:MULTISPECIES: IclR family transcriptional regulator [unclassified Nocardioides]ABL83592.1 transcriptional regulator, IclR family [Nocardioides sp. JS614]